MKNVQWHYLFCNSQIILNFRKLLPFLDKEHTKIIVSCKIKRLISTVFESDNIFFNQPPFWINENKINKNIHGSLVEIFDCLNLWSYLGLLWFLNFYRTFINDHFNQKSSISKIGNPQTYFIYINLRINCYILLNITHMNIVQAPKSYWIINLFYVIFQC